MAKGIASRNSGLRPDNMRGSGPKYSTGKAMDRTSHPSRVGKGNSIGKETGRMGDPKGSKCC